MDWKKLLGSITASVDEELRLRNAYLIAENRILRQQITGRVPLTDGERKTLAELGQQLGKQALAEIATVARPDTILAWHRAFADQPCDSSQPPKSVGRPRIDKELEDLVVHMARENRSWGYDRIVGALSNLGYRISDQTVGNVLKRQGIPPAPERKKTVTWREFIRIHLDVLGATDFFRREAWGWWELVISCLLSWIFFAREHACGVSVTLDHQVRRMRLFLSQARDGYAYRQSSVHGVKKCARLQMVSCAEGVLGTTIAASICSEQRQPCTQHMAPVVCLPTAYHRQRRDDPRRCHQGLDGLWKDHDCEAA
jgi:transposase